MKAVDRAYQNLETVLKAYGLELADGFCGKQIKGGEYVGYQVWDRHDSFDADSMTAHGHIEVTAAIRRMGGEMTAEDFAEAAAEMQTAQAVLAELAEADLGYTADVNGEEVA